MLISDAYRKLNAQHHYEAQEWGLQSIKYWKIIRGIAQELGVETLLDYGCGKRALERALAPHGIKVTNYDPAFPEFASTPAPHDFVVCTDVLEHVEPECLHDVLDDLYRVTLRQGFFVVATRPSLNPMPDGSNPHRIIQPMDWWLQELREAELDPLEMFNPGEKYFMVKVKPRRDLATD